MEGIFPGLLEQLVFDGDERGLTEALQGQNHPIGQQAVHQDPADTPTITFWTFYTVNNLLTFNTEDTVYNK